MTTTELTEILDRYTCIQCEILKAQVIKAMVEAVDKTATTLVNSTKGGKIGYIGSGNAQVKAGKLYDWGNSVVINVSDLKQ